MNDRLEILETGIKAIDFYAPIPRKGSAKIEGNRGAGTLVTVLELLKRLAVDARLPAALIYHKFKETDETKELEKDFRDTFGESPENPKLVPVGWQKLDELRQLLQSSGALDARLLFVVADYEALIKNVHRLYLDEARSGFRSDEQTLVVASAEYVPIRFDAVIRLSRFVATLGIYPSLDPRLSSSKVLDNPLYVDHKSLAATVSDRVGRFLDAGDSTRMDEGPENIQEAQMLRFGSQPYYLIESLTKLPAERVSVAETVDAFSQIARGAVEDLPPQAFYMTHSIKSVREKAASFKRSAS